MIQVRLGVAGAALAFGAHTSHVYTTRKAAPSGRLLQFSPGSQDDIVADTLRTGDLVVFARDCVLYPCLEASVCAARKELTGLKYDHAGVIVSIKGVPHVLEQTAAGPKLRRYDARVKASLAREVVVRPLDLKLSPEQQASVSQFVAARCPGAATSSAGPGTEAVQPKLQVQGYDSPAPTLAGMLAPLAGVPHVRDLAMLAVMDRAHNPSVQLVQDFYQHLGVLPPTAAVRMEQLANPHYQPFPQERFKRAVWVRDMR